MGTRADFYVGRGLNAEWLGSIAWDGYPDGIDNDLLASTTEELFRNRCAAFLERRRDSTRPEAGWPWPWEDSCTTDFSYAFDGGTVYISPYGHGWHTRAEYEAAQQDEEASEEIYNASKVVFPNMKHVQKVTLGPRSGVLVFGVGESPADDRG